jgi:hypothetical protein
LGLRCVLQTRGWHVIGCVLQYGLCPCVRGI